MSDAAIVFKTHENPARPPKSTPLPSDHPARRKPLGLAPGGGSSEPVADEPAAFVSVAASLSAEARARAATIGDVAEALDTAIAIDRDGDELFRAKIGEMRNLISDLKGELIEARYEIRELKLIQEILAHLHPRRKRPRRHERNSGQGWPARADRTARRARRARPAGACDRGLGAAPGAVRNRSDLRQWRARAERRAIILISSV